MNKGTAIEDNINIFCEKHKGILNKMDDAYRYMRLLDVTSGYSLHVLLIVLLSVK